MKKNIQYIILFFLSTGILQSQWIQNFNGPDNGNDAANCVLIDNDNNIIVSGYCKSARGDDDMAVVKYSSNGGFLWSYIYNGTGNTEDRPYGIIVDQSDNIIITGESSADFCTIKFDPLGTVTWIRKYADPNSGIDRAYGIIVDNLNNIIITGSSYGGPANGNDILTIKYDPQGSQVWSYRFNGSGNNEDRPYGIIVDQQDNIVFTGTTFSSSSLSLDYITMMLSPGGIPLWTRLYNGSGSSEDRSYGIITDRTGTDIFITGASMGLGSGFDFVTIGYDSGGTEIFNKRFNSADDNDDIAGSLALTTNNEIIVTGISRISFLEKSEDVRTIKYEQDGTERWNKSYNGSGNSSDAAFKVVTPQYSNSYASVIGYTTGSNGKDILVLSYSNVGNLNREYIINGSDNKDDEALNGVSVANELVFTGYETRLNSHEDFYTSFFFSENLTEINRNPVGIPSSFKLYQNYPNPFNPETKIRFDIPRESMVNITIYNSAGQQAAVPVNRTMEPGAYEILFRAGNLSSGVYFCVLKTENGYRQANKLLIIK